MTIDGTSQVDGDVFGGGDASKVSGSATITLQGQTTIEGNVFGGGNEAEVTGSTVVNIKNN